MNRISSFSPSETNRAKLQLIILFNRSIHRFHCVEHANKRFRDGTDATEHLQQVKKSINERFT